MTHRSAVPLTPAFERIARGAQFRDRIAIVVEASPKAIFQALHDVALRHVHGEKVVDLWGGIRNKETGEGWERDTMVLVYPPYIWWLGVWASTRAPVLRASD